MHILQQWQVEADMKRRDDRAALARLDDFDRRIVELSMVLQESRSYVRSYWLRCSWRKARRASHKVKQQQADLRRLIAARMKFVKNYVPKP